MYSSLARRGLTVPGGSCPSVGIAGLALGGGHGLAGRRWGLTTDNIRAVTMVTADGRVRQVTEDSDEDLFWACQGGGGGNFGIVTSLTLQTHRTRGAAWFFISFPVVAGERGAGGLAGLRPGRAADAHLDLLARDRLGLPGRDARSASSSARRRSCAG